MICVLNFDRVLFPMYFAYISYNCVVRRNSNALIVIRTQDSGFQMPFYNERNHAPWKNK